MAFPDPAHPSVQVDWRAIFKATLPYVDIFLPSIEELLMALHRPLIKNSVNKPIMNSWP